MMTTTDCLNGRYGTWQQDQFVPYDNSHQTARTDHALDWNGYFTARCPHGKPDTLWSAYYSTPMPMCGCHG